MRPRPSYAYGPRAACRRLYCCVPVPRWDIALLFGLAIAGCGDTESDNGENGNTLSVGAGGPGSAPPSTEAVTGACQNIDVSQADAALEEEMLQLVNSARGNGGRCGSKEFPPSTPLNLQPQLSCAARAHSLDMMTRGFFDHDNPDGESPFDRYKALGYRFSRAAENISLGARDAPDTLERWMDSDGHCANILDPELLDIGIGVAGQNAGAVYWTQTFGRRL